MTSVAEMVRLRRRRRRAASGGWVNTILLTLIASAALAFGVGVVAAGRVVFAAASDLPPASSLERIFGPAGSERFRAPQLFDRTGDALLAEVLHPLAHERQWATVASLPDWIPQATIAALDPSFWTNAGYDPASVVNRIWQAILGRTPTAPAPTITERLAQQTMVREGAPLAAALLADDIAATYSKERVLAWFLNSADYGNLAFGIDAAARVYFGKPATALTLAETAMLASLPAHPEVDPFEDPAAAKGLQREVLDAMMSQGMISPQEAASARAENLRLQADEARRAMQGLGFVEAVWQELRDRVGPGAATQGGARVITTLDLDLQLQADCVARSYLARMDGGDPLTVLPAADGSPCAAASLLPPLRPSDSGVDHAIEAAATVLLDPASGEILALTGPVAKARPAGNVLSPLVFLSAFSRGYTPATMIIDADAGDGEGGPVRLRTALAEGDAGLSQQLAALVGPAVVDSTFDLMGVETADALEETPVRLDDLAAALGLLANRGVQAGAAAGESGVEATTISAVYGSDESELYRMRPERRSVISEGLSFLLNDILSDEAAKSVAFGPSSALQIGRPSATVSGQTATDNYALGYTPQRVAAVWVGAEPGETLAGVHALNGAAPIWHALLRYASRDLPSATWSLPPDVTELDVCDPSGYLPTPYCPRVVREVFLLGTEPTHSDTLYQPFRINKETGRLATYFTPLDQVEEIVYFVPPPEAQAWAQSAGLEPPPSEYDRIPVAAASSPELRITGPAFFDLVAGEIEISGSAAGEGFASYRLDVGEGLDPRAWLQIGEAQTAPVSQGRLGRWDTAGRNGAWILRLTVVRQDGSVESTAVPVTLDNRPPSIEIVLPLEGAEFAPPGDTDIAIQVEASDETQLDRVVFFVDDRAILTRDGPPWSGRWPLGRAGEHIVRARAYDAAGNWTDSENVTIRVVR